MRGAELRNVELHLSEQTALRYCRKRACVPAAVSCAIKRAHWPLGTASHAWEYGLTSAGPHGMVGHRLELATKVWGGWRHGLATPPIAVHRRMRTTYETVVASALWLAVVGHDEAVVRRIPQLGSVVHDGLWDAGKLKTRNGSSTKDDERLLQVAFWNRVLSRPFGHLCSVRCTVGIAMSAGTRELRRAMHGHGGGPVGGTPCKLFRMLALRTRMKCIRGRGGDDLGRASSSNDRKPSSVSGRRPTGSAGIPPGAHQDDAMFAAVRAGWRHPGHGWHRTADPLLVALRAGMCVLLSRTAF